MGRGKVPLLPVASECCESYPLAGVHRSVMDGRCNVNRGGRYLGRAGEGQDALAWNLLKADVAREKKTASKQEEVVSQGNSGARASSRESAEEELSRMEKRTVMVHCRVMEHTLGHLMQGDLSTLPQAYRSHSDMFEACPGLWLASVQGKYWPWRDALYQAYLQDSGSSSSRHAKRSSAKRSSGVLESWGGYNAPRLARIMMQAARAMSGVDTSSWVKHCGKKVSFHSGFLALLLRMGIVILHLPEGESTYNHYERLQLSVNPGDFHYLVPEADDRRPVLEGLGRYCQAGAALWDALKVPPKTCRDWVCAVEALLPKLKKLGSLSMAGTRTYLPLWTFRASAYQLMQVAGMFGITSCKACCADLVKGVFVSGLCGQVADPPISRLTGCTDVTVAEFAKTIPDQGTWMEKCA